MYLIQTRISHLHFPSISCILYIILLSFVTVYSPILLLRLYFPKQGTYRINKFPERTTKSWNWMNLFSFYKGKLITTIYLCRAVCITRKKFTNDISLVRTVRGYCKWTYHVTKVLFLLPGIACRKKGIPVLHTDEEMGIYTMYSIHGLCCSKSWRKT